MSLRRTQNGRFTTRPLPFYFTTRLSFVRLFWILCKDEIEPQENGPFSSKTESVGVELSGPNGSRHSSDQHPKDVQSEHSSYCPNFVREVCPPEGKLPRCGISAFWQCLNFCPASRACRGTEILILCLFYLLLRACLKTPALTGYVRDTQGWRPSPLLLPKCFPLPPEFSTFAAL